MKNYSLPLWHHTAQNVPGPAKPGVELCYGDQSRVIVVAGDKKIKKVFCDIITLQKMCPV